MNAIAEVKQVMVVKDKFYEKDWVKSLSVDAAQELVRKRIELQCHILERLCDAGLLRGSGWHMAQEVGRFGAKLVRENWMGNEAPYVVDIYTSLTPDEIEKEADRLVESYKGKT